MSDLINELKEVIDGEVFFDDATRADYSRDASIFEVHPASVVKVRSVEDVKKLVRFVSSKKKQFQDISITARAAGTCMSGGSLTESISVDMLALSHIGEIEGSTLVVEPGAYYRDFEKVTLGKGLIMPAYTASKGICTVGGMVANNSSGEKSLVYGDTGDYVKKLKVILRDGNEYEIAPMTASALIEAKNQGGVVGDIYKKMHELLDDNFSLVAGAKPNVSKNSSGYLLWDVWDRKTFDLTKLFVGSQGTLGIITEITFDLVQNPTVSRLLVIALDSLDEIPSVVERVLSHRPDCFESFDDNTWELATKYMKEDADRVITNKGVVLTLIAEFTGFDVTEVGRRAEEARLSLVDLPVQAVLCGSEEEAQSYWNIRRASFRLLREHVEGSHRVAPFIDDIIVQPAHLAEFLPRLDQILRQYKLVYTIAGHIGDGNFHLIPLVDMSQEIERNRIIELSKKVFDLVFEYGGSMAGEHNDGIIRTPFLKNMYGDKLVDLFRATKQIFDPENIFNPGKKVGGTLEYAVKHYAKDNKINLY